MQKSPMVQSEWKNGTRVSEVLCDRKMNVKINGKYSTVVRHALVPGAETLALKEVQEKNSEVTEILMHRWMCRVAKLQTG